MFTKRLYIETLPIQAYRSLDLPVFIKNLKSQYLWVNDFFIRYSQGCHSLADIVNKQDKDFQWHCYADELVAHDLQVLKRAQSFHVYERVLSLEGLPVNLISKKCPLYNQEQKIVGLFGFSMEIPQPARRILSRREYAAAMLVAEGYTDKEIAKKWGISARTVESHIIKAKQKLGVATRAELIVSLYRGPIRDFPD